MTCRTCWLTWSPDRREGIRFSARSWPALRDAGILQVEGAVGRLRPGVRSLDDLHFPLTVQGVVTSRIDRLDSERQLTLKTASVIGRIFAVQAVRDIHPSQEIGVSVVDAHLADLDRLDLVHPEAIEPSLRYIFKHSITHGVVYQMMTNTQRRALHQRAADWYEARFADNLVPYYPLLAFHWARAEKPDQAIRYFELAGEEAFQHFAHEEAVSFFLQALERDEQAGFPNPKERRAAGS
jgi:predicted ATPase